MPIRSTMAVVALTMGCMAAGPTSAMPLASAAAAVNAPVSPVQHVAHDKHYWFGEGGGWWRYGPWVDHAIVGTVVSPSWPIGTVWQHWGVERLRICAERYSSFDPVTGTYLTPHGERLLCRLAPLK